MCRRLLMSAKNALSVRGRNTVAERDAVAAALPADAVGFDSIAVRAGQRRTAEGEHSEPLFLSSSYVFASAREAAARFADEEEGNVYSRYTNPTVRAFEERLAALEGAEEGVATASGMAAITTLCMALLQSGDHIVCSRSVFGATLVLLRKHLARFGVTVDFVALTELSSWEAAIHPGQTKLLFLETPSNPMGEIADIGALAELAHDHGAWLVVDNCFCTPALQQPLSLGADLVVHSATKYIDGHGRCLGGMVLGRSEQMTMLRAFLRAAGSSMSPFNAWVFSSGLSTLRLRMEAYSRNADRLACWLLRQEQVEQVFYPGLEDHPGHQLAARQQSGFGGVLAFNVSGGRERAWTFIDAVELLSRTANFGDVKSTIVHPATTTHAKLSPSERSAAGIGEGLIRIAAGLEDADDLIRDLQRGFAALG